MMKKAYIPALLALLSLLTLCGLPRLPRAECLLRTGQL